MNLFFPFVSFFCLLRFYFFFHFDCDDAGDYMRTVSSAVTINDSSFVCKENFIDTRTLGAVKISSTINDVEPIIYFVTPTYPRREQIAELTRLGQTLMHVRNLHWIVADDVDGCNSYLDTLLNRFGMLCIVITLFVL